MWAAMRRYEGITDDAEAGRLVGESFIPQLEDIPGFVAYYWIDAGDGVMASLSVFGDKDGADKSVELARRLGSGKRGRAHPEPAFRSPKAPSRATPRSAIPPQPPYEGAGAASSSVCETDYWGRKKLVLARRAICISHLPGAGGEAVGRAVADRLDFRYVDEEVIAEAAESADLDPALIEDAERRKPLVSRLLGSLAERSSPTRLPDSALAERSLPSSGELQGLIGDALRVLADEGSVVIVAHAGSVALAGGDVLRVLVTASTETRVERVAAAKRIDDRAATRRVREEDAARADYLKRFYGIQDEVPTLFDLVLNTDVLGPEKAAEVVLVAAA